jgi:hypothetical protein
VAAGDREPAARLFGASDVLRRETGAPERAEHDASRHGIEPVEIGRDEAIREAYDVLHASGRPRSRALPRATS